MDTFLRNSPPAPREAIERQIIMVCGKGGVGKSVITEAIALRLAAKGHRTLWIEIENPTRPTGEPILIEQRLWRLNTESMLAFEEYMALKIRIPTLAKLFTKNQLIRTLAKASPGIHELVLLGKIWHERENYDRIVVDMPSTGYSLAMFESTRNFSQLFAGPLQKDAEAMLQTFGDPTRCGLLIIALPEEMPLRESLELDSEMIKIFPENRAAFIVNKRFPIILRPEDLEVTPDSWPSPYADSLLDYIHKRAVIEHHNLRIWRDQDLGYAELPFLAKESGITRAIADEMARMGFC